MKHLDIKIPNRLIQLPYLEFKGGSSNKKCIISGGVHGDEVNGIILVKEFIDYCRENNIEKDLNGQLIIIPIVNRTGFIKQKRFVTYDRKDLNRSFNCNVKTASNLIANALEKAFYSKADLAIDCHDSGTRQILLPHTRVHKYEDKYCTNCTREMAKAFGSKIIIERKGKRGMLAIEMARRYQLPVLTIEIGGALKVDRRHIKNGLDGILNILKNQGFLKGEAKILPKQYYLTNRFGIPAKQSGIINLERKLGQRVHLGDRLGTIYIPSKARAHELLSPMCGIIFSMQHIDIIRKGDIMLSILEDKKCHKKRRMTSGMFEEIKNIKMVTTH